MLSLFEHSVHLSFCQVPRYILCLCGRAAIMRLHTGKTLEMFNNFLPLMGLRILSPSPPVFSQDTSSAVLFPLKNCADLAFGNS